MAMKTLRPSYSLHSLTHAHRNIPLKRNQRAYISASLRFLASTIISCNSTDTSSGRIRRQKRREGGEIKQKQRKLKRYSKAKIEFNRVYIVRTDGSAVQADKSLCVQQLCTVRGNLFCSGSIFVLAIMMIHQ